MATSYGLVMVMSGAVLSCLALLSQGVASGVAPRGVPQRSWGYRRFHANDSLIGQRVPCTHKEKLCFNHNLLYSSDSRRCTQLTFDTYADSKEFLSGSGHLLVTNSTPFPSFYGVERMAYDGVYYSENVIQDVLCGCNKDLSPPILGGYSNGLSPHILGGYECRCAPPQPVHIEQPSEDGTCIVPDLRFPDIMRQYFFRSPYDGIQGFTAEQLRPADINPPPQLRRYCSHQQRDCFSREQLWLEGACYPLLQRGPCSEEHVVTLDAQAAAANADMNTTCTHVRGGCPPGHLRMAFDNACHSEDDLRAVVPGEIRPNQFGVHIALHYGIFKLEFYPSIDKSPGKNDICILTILASFYEGGYGIPVARPECGVNDDGKCALHEIRNTPPQPEL